MRSPQCTRGMAVVFGLLASAACTQREDPALIYRLTDVVAPAIAELEARIGSSAEPVAPPIARDSRERVAGLLEALASSDERMREIALEDARALASSELALVAEMLHDESLPTSARDAASRVLGEHPGLVSGEALCAALEACRDPIVRRQCAFQLGRAAPHCLWPRMLLRLRYELDGETVVWLTHALSRRGNLAGLEGLRVLLATSGDEAVRGLAAAVGAGLAAEFGAPDLESLAARWRSGEFEASHPPVEPDDRTRLEGWRQIAKLVVFDLRQVDDARFVLVESAAWVVPLLAATLRDGTAHARVHAAQCLERRAARSSLAFDALVEALREPTVAPSAAAALGALGESRACEPLARVLGAQSALDLRVAAARALGRLHAAEASGALLRSFDASEPLDLRQAAAEALLARDAHEPAYDFLLEILRSRQGDVDGAESALETHLGGHAIGDEHARILFERWRALDVQAGGIATLAEARARQAARARLLGTR